MTEPAHPQLHIIQDHTGIYFIEVVQGADRIVMTPYGLETLDDATRCLQGIRAWTQPPRGMTR